MAQRLRVLQTTVGFAILHSLTMRAEGAAAPPKQAARHSLHDRAKKTTK
nr:hypothetical protein [Burkholderia diffusa]